MNLTFDLNNYDLNNLKTEISEPKKTTFESKLSKLSNKEKALHDKALSKASNFKKAHKELLNIVIEVTETKLYQKFDLTSVHAYCLDILELSSDVTCTLTTLTRVSQKIPELKIAIDEGLHITHARMVSSIVTPDNKTEWIEKAKKLSQRKLQKEIAKSFPLKAVQEKTKYVADKRIKLEVGLNEDTLELLNWAQDFVSQYTNSAANIETTLKEVLTDYKERHDPIEKAKRARNRKAKKEAPVAQRVRTLQIHATNTTNSHEKCVAPKRGSSNLVIHNRTATPTEVIHQVNLRDKCECQFTMPDETICGNKRWLQYHHIIEVQHGGTNTLENLTTLCSQHHRMLHRQ